MASARLPELSLTEWAVLALVAEQPTHGFAVSKELAGTGDIGRIWTVPRPLVYRALATLEELATRGADRRGVRRPRTEPHAPPRDAPRQAGRRAVAGARRCRTCASCAPACCSSSACSIAAASTSARSRWPSSTSSRRSSASLKSQATTAEGFDRLLASWRYESALAASRVLEGVLGG